MLLTEVLAAEQSRYAEDDPRLAYTDNPLARAQKMAVLVRLDLTPRLKKASARSDRNYFS